MSRNVWININSKIILTSTHLTELEDVLARGVDSQGELNVIKFLTTEQWNSLFLSFLYEHF